MMRSIRHTASAIALASLVLVTGAAAQNAATAGAGMQFGIGGGLSMPMGDFGDAVETGFNVHGMLGFNPAMIPFGVRLDVGYDRWGFKGDADIDGSFSSISGALDAIFKLPGTSVSPYILAGPGLNHLKADFDDDLGDDDLVDESQTKFSINAGGGIQFNLAGMATHLEAKVVNIFTEGEATRYIPITFGVMFGGGTGNTGGMKRDR